MISHWRRVFTDPEYRRTWLYLVGASTSSWFFVTFWGGGFGRTVSADVHRRTLAGEKLGLVMTIVRFCGDTFVFRPGHWKRAYTLERIWFKRSVDSVERGELMNATHEKENSNIDQY